MSEVEISDTVSVAEEQHYIDEYYDETEDKMDTKFEDFLKNRTPPTMPEKIEDLMTKQELLSKQKQESGNDNETKKYKLDNNNVREETNKQMLSKTQINKMLKEQSSNIAKQANEIKKKNDYLPDLEYIERNNTFFKKFLNYVIDFDHDMNIVNIMHEWTNFKYSPYNDLKTNYIRQAGERVVIIEQLGEIFNHNFLTYINAQNYRFDSLNFEITKFIGNTSEKHKIPTKFEYNFIKNMLSRVLICMLCNVDRCFIGETTQINNHFKKAVQHYLNEFSHILKTHNKISHSWEVFESCLFLSQFDSQIFKYNGANDLKDKLIECYKDNDNFLIEQLIANTLKTFIPTIAYSYFTYIKNIYLIGRLLSIYANKQLYKGKTKEQIEIDLYIIASALTIEYEINYIANINVRCTPVCKNGKELSKQTELYYINHLISGPQYCLLKQLELSLPTLSETFIN